MRNLNRVNSCHLIDVASYDSSSTRIVKNFVKKNISSELCRVKNLLMMMCILHDRLSLVVATSNHCSPDLMASLSGLIVGVRSRSWLNKSELSSKETEYCEVNLLSLQKKNFPK